MKRIVLALAALSIGGTALAQQPTPAPVVEVAKPKCEPKPEYPGRLASDTRRKVFDREMKGYKDCMNVYLEERKAAMKANELAANAAIEEHNAVMKKVADDQNAERGSK